VDNSGQITSLRPAMTRLHLILLTGALFAPLLPAHGQDVAHAMEARPIFDGKSLSGWKGMDSIWKVEDGAITGQTTVPDQVPFNTFLIWQDGEVDDFELDYDYKIVGGNSGVQIRAYQLPGSQPEEYRVAGYQSDIDSGDTYTGIVYSEGERGILAERGQATTITPGEKPNKPKVAVSSSLGDKMELQKGVKKEDWNHFKIVAKGNVITNYVNGVKFCEVVDNDPASARSSGKLAIQVHKWNTPMKIQLKNVMLKRLPLQNKKKVVFLAGRPSHAPGEHEHRAGCMLLAAELNKHFGDKILATVHTGGWPADATALDNADAIISYTDGGGGHPINFHARQLDAIMKCGVGLGCIHYGVETTKGEYGTYFLDWIGGYFEPHWSVNPHWKASYDKLPEHEVTRGVKPFASDDEWYYHMRFREGMKDVTPILTALPPAETLKRGDGPHSGNPDVRAAVAKGEPQHMMWVATRDGGKGRGFGVTGGHYHKNWGQADYRKLVLNAIAWIAKVPVPENGLPVSDLDDAALQANQDEKQPRKPKPAAPAPAPTPGK
jgi:type 1 glutamine amidotransferase